MSPSAVGIKNDRAKTAQFQVLRHNGLGQAEPCSIRTYIGAAVSKITERLELIGRVHSHADDVLGKSDFTGIGFLAYQLARHRHVGGDRAARCQKLQRQQTPLPGDDRMLACGRSAPAEARAQLSSRRALQGPC